MGAEAAPATRGGTSRGNTIGTDNDRDVRAAEGGSADAVRVFGGELAAAEDGDRVSDAALARLFAQGDAANPEEQYPHAIFGEAGGIAGGGAEGYAGGDGRDRGEFGDGAFDRAELWRPGGDCGRDERDPGGAEWACGSGTSNGGIAGAASVYGGFTGPGFVDTDERGNAGQQFFVVADCLCGDSGDGDVVARL